MTLIYSITLKAEAKTVILENAETFDSNFYAEMYPDVKAAYGTDVKLLLQHYLTYGIKEGRLPSLSIKSTTSSDSSTVSTLVPIDQLSNKTSLKKKLY